MNRLKKPVQTTILTMGALLSVVMAQDATEATATPAPAQNSAPSVNGIPGETIDEGKAFAPVKLDSYVSDPEDKADAIRWTATGQKNLQVTITNRVATISVIDPEWSGEETITFTATDAKGASGAETITFSVMSVNDKPVIQVIPAQEVNEGVSLKPVNLDDFIADVDHPDDQISWNADVQYIGKDKAEGDMYVNIDDKRVARFEIPDTNWFGAAKVTFTATDGDGESVSTSTNVSIKSINDLPIVQKAPDQTIEEGNEFDTFNLNDLVSDADDDPYKMKWEVTGGNQLKASIDKYNTVSIKIPNQDWNGPTETFTFTATDAKGGQASFKASFTVKSVNDEPVLEQVKDQTVNEGKAFAPINLAEAVKDPDHDFSKLKWTFTGNKDLRVQLNGPMATIAIPDTNWNGYETISFKVTDPEGASAETMASFTVNSINDLPVMQDVPSQTIAEGKQFVAIKLDDLVGDADHKDADLAWDFVVKHQGKEPETGTLMVNMDDNRVARIAIPDSNWNGAASVTFTVTDPEGGKASKTALFTVTSTNDLPALRQIADQTVEEGNQFDAIALGDFVSDSDHPVEKLTWELSGLNQLKAKLDPKSLMLTITAPHEDWGGPTETLNITVKDPEGGSATIRAKFTVKSINDLPEVVKPIESQAIDEKKAFAVIDLGAAVKDRDHAPEQLKWTVLGNKALQVAISADRKATVKIPSPNWNGEETLSFTVTDPEGGKAESQATFTVRSINDLPVLKEIPGQTIAEGKTFAAIKLDDLVNDADHPKDKLAWETSVAPASGKGSAQLQVTIDANRLAHIVVPDTNWYGSEVVTFTVTDPEGGRATSKASFTVNSVNDLPVVSKIADQAIDEGAEFASINLDAMAFDADHAKDKLAWTVTGNQKLVVTVDGKTRTATVKAPSKLYNGGPETLTFTVTDPEGGKASTTAKFTVKSINNVPSLAEIPAQTINEGAAFAAIDLSKLAADEDNTFRELKWNVTGNKAVKVNIDASGKANLVIPGENWHGEETITFTVSDSEGAKASRTANFKVNSVNDLPTLKKVGDQSIDEGKKFAVIDLNDLVTDGDHADEQISWQISSVVAGAKKPTGGELKFAVEKGKLTINTPDENWNGSEVVTFTAVDPEGGKATTSATFTVKSINDLPSFAKPADQNVQEKQAFAPINLGSLVKDADHSFDKLKWEITGNKDLKIALDKNGLATITAPSKFWNGTEKVTITVTDPEGGRASQTVVLSAKSINDVPMIGAIKGQSIDEGKEFSPIALDAIVTDDDHPKERLKWTVAGGKNLRASVDGSRVVTLKTPSPDWNGAETLTFTVTDPEGATASANVVFEVRSINDKPELKTIAEQMVDEGKSFRTIRLDDLVSDADHKKEDLKWTAQVLSAAAPAKKGAAPAPAAGNDLKVSIDANRVATITAPDEDWNGGRKVVFTVTDPEGASASQTATFSVRSVNDVPQTHKDLETPKVVNEGEQFPEVDLAKLVRDADHPFASLKMAVTGNRELKAAVVANKLKVTTPNAEWAGKETIVLTVTDPEGGKADARIAYEVKAVNDPPVIAKIGDQAIKEGESFKSINLADLVKDPDHKFNELKWTIAGAKNLKAEIRGTNLIVSTPNENYYGAPETLTLTATDPQGASASAVATFTVASVNDLPQIKSVSPQNIREGQQFKEIRLDDIVEDADHKKEQLNWTATISGGAKAAPAKKGAAPAPAANDLKVEIDTKRVARFVLPNENWNGERVATLTATDPEGGKASISLALNVASVNDAPVISNIADQVISEGEKFNFVDLSVLAKDADHPSSALSYSVSGGRELKATVNAKGILSVATPNNDWSGEEKFNVTVSDPEGGRASESVLFKAKAVNDAPVVKALPGQKIKEGDKFALIELSEVATDVDNKPNELIWTASGNKELKVEFNKGRPQARISAPSDKWFGKETIEFTVKDPAGASASTKALFEVTAVNDAPTLSRPSDQSIDEGGKFVSLDFGKLVKDVDDRLEDLQWTLDDGLPGGRDAKGKPTRGKPSTVKHQIRFDIDEKGVLTAQVPNADWFGNEVVRINVWDAANAKASVDIKFVVKPVNDAPVVNKQLEGQSVFQGSAFKTINLDDLVSDSDHQPGQIRWAASSQRFDVNINASRVATIKAKRNDWSGLDKVTFTAMDPLGAKITVAADFEVKHVNATPELRPIPAQTVQEDVSFKPIKMDQLAKDADHKFDQLKWDISGNKELLVKVDRVRNEIQISQPRPNWNGKPETLVFKVTDPDGASATQTASFTVNPVNDAPEVISHAYTTREGEELKVSKTDGVLSGATDPDGEKPGVAMLVNRPTNGKLTLNEDGSFVYTPKPGFYGLDEFTFKARDNGGVYSKVERAEVNVSFRMGDVRKEEVKDKAGAAVKGIIKK